MMKTLAVFIILYSVKIDSIFKSRVPFIFLKVKRLRVGGCLLATGEPTILSGDFTECTSLLLANLRTEKGLKHRRG